MNIAHSPLAALPALLPAIAEAAARHDADASFPHDSLALLKEIGLPALTVPAALGGGGGGLRQAVEAVTQIGRACPATALVTGMQFVRHTVLAHHTAWPEAVRRAVQRDAVENGGLINTLRVEPELGSPTRGGLPATIARRTAEGWLLSGRKRYATGAPGLSWFEVYARTDEAEPRVGSFLVAADSPGLRIVPTWNHLGMRASGSDDVVFEDVLLPHEHAVALGAPGTLPQPDWRQQAWNAAIVSAVYQGVALAARDWTVRFLQERAPASLGAPLATLPRVQEAIGQVEGLLSANRRLLASLAISTDEDTPPHPAESSTLKVLIAENIVRAVEQCTLLAGNHAHDRAFALERHWRDAQCARVHVPTPDAAYLAAGRLALAS